MPREVHSNALFLDNYPAASAFPSAKLIGGRHPQYPRHPAGTLQHGPTGPSAPRNVPVNKHFFEFLDLPVPLSAVGVSPAPIAQHERRAKPLSIKSRASSCSVALLQRPVNHFLAEAAFQFWDGNMSFATLGQADHMLICGCRLFGSRFAGIGHEFGANASRELQLSENPLRHNASG